MDPKAIQQAEQRFSKAENAFERLCVASCSRTTQDAWSDFLSSASTVYSKLEQGAKTNGRSSAWFGQKKYERKSDPLLSYIHQARNSDEHGIEEVTQTRTQQHLVGEVGGLSVSVSTSDDGTFSDFVGVLPDGKRVPISTYKSQTVRLVAVTNTRFGDTFDVPRSHFGEELPDVLDPAYVAGLAISYLKNLIDEARGLAS